MINPQWLEQPLSRTIFYGPKYVRGIEVRLYLHCIVEAQFQRHRKKRRGTSGIKTAQHNCINRIENKGKM